MPSNKCHAARVILAIASYFGLVIACGSIAEFLSAALHPTLQVGFWAGAGCAALAGVAWLILQDWFGA